MVKYNGKERQLWVEIWSWTLVQEHTSTCKASVSEHCFFKSASSYELL